MNLECKYLYLNITVALFMQCDGCKTSPHTLKQCCYQLRPFKAVKHANTGRNIELRSTRAWTVLDMCHGERTTRNDSGKRGLNRENLKIAQLYKTRDIRGIHVLY